MQSVVTATPPVAQDDSDSLAMYAALVYASGSYQALPNKSQIYSVEADNAELSHFLARLGLRSRCFSRSLHALHDAITLFVFAWNRRQLAKRVHPRYTYHVTDFLYP